jgi:hypothetical protein
MSVPFSELTPPTPFPASEYFPPWDQGGGEHSLAGEGVGGANSDNRTESLALCIISGVLFIRTCKTKA